MVQSARLIVGQDKPALVDGHKSSRRDQVDRIRLHLHMVGSLEHGHGRVLAQDIRHQALIVSRQMLYHHKAQAAVGRHTAEKLLQRLHAPSGRADADDQR